MRSRWSLPGSWSLLPLSLGLLLGFEAPGVPPARSSLGAAEVVWSGTATIRQKAFPSRLYRLPSRKGVRPGGIDQCLALVAFGRDPPASLLIVIGGSRGPSASRSFRDELGDGYIGFDRFLEAGYAIATIEYRGSQTPGKKEKFSPPLPPYEELIPGFSQDSATEYGLGDAYDAVAASTFLVSGEPFPLPPGRAFVLGGSHGGYLALRVARDVAGIEGVAAGHPPVDLKGCFLYFEDAPLAFAKSFFGQSPRLAVNFPIGGATTRQSYAEFSRELQGLGLTDPSLSLLDKPPQARSVLLWTNIDDALVPAFNSRRYMARWSAERAGLHYYEYASEEVPELFPASAEALKRRGIASTHNEEIPGTALEQAMLRVLGLEEGPVKIPERTRGPIHVALTLDVSGVADGAKAPKEGAEVVIHDGPGWFAPEPQRGKSDAQGRARFEKAPIGFQYVDVRFAGGVTRKDISVYIPRAPSGPLLLFDLAGGAPSQSARSE